MMNMAINAAGGRSPRGRVGVGAGWQNGESALSVGYSKQIGERASFSIGGAFSSDEIRPASVLVSTCDLPRSALPHPPATRRRRRTRRAPRAKAESVTNLF